MKAFLILTLFFIGCGEPPAQNAELPQETKQKEEVDTQEINTKSIAGTEQNSRGIMVLLTGQELPACETANQGETFYLEAMDEFQTCSGQGWKVINLRGADGLKGEKGDQGLQGDVGLKGEKGDTGEQGLQGIAGPQGDQGIQGEQGTQGLQGEQGIQGIQGVKGDTGTAGANGADGADGLNGLGAIGVYDDSNTYVGVSLGDEAVMFDGGGIANINFADGTFFDSYAYIGSRIDPAYCTFTSNDCSGTCYANNINAFISGTMKNAAFYNGATWLLTTGDEVDGGAMTIRSVYNNGVCSNAFGSIESPVSFPIVTGFTLPNSLTMPLGNMYLDAL